MFNFALNWVVTYSNELLVKNLVIQYICTCVQLNRISIDQAYKKSKNGGAKTHRVFKREHLFILLTGHIQEGERIVVLSQKV